MNNQLDPFGTNSLLEDFNNSNQQIANMNLPPLKEQDPFRNQQIGNILLAFSDVLGGRNPATGVMQRQALINAQREEAERKKKFDEEFAKLNPNQQAIVRQQMAGINLPQNKLTADQQNYNLAVNQGYKGTFMDYLNEKKAPLVNLQPGEKVFEEEQAKLAIGTVKEERKNVAAGKDIDDRLLVLEKAIDNVDTGALEELKLPFKKLAAALNILPSDQLEQLNQQELFQSFTGYIIPRMRVVGSGATSDREIELFKSAVPTIGNTKEGNKLLIGGLRAITKYNKERLRLMENYVQQNETVFGFEDFADKQLGSIYKSFNSVDEYENLVKNGVLKEGDFVFDGVRGQFIIINKEDIQAAYK